jgi:hypothetical protein
MMPAMQATKTSEWLFFTPTPKTLKPFLKNIREYR